VFEGCFHLCDPCDQQTSSFETLQCYWHVLQCWELARLFFSLVFILYAYPTSFLHPTNDNEMCSYLVTLVANSETSATDSSVRELLIHILSDDLAGMMGWFITVVLKVKWYRYRPGVAQRVGRGIALLFHNCGTRRGLVVSSTPQPHFTLGKDPVPIVQEAGWAPGLVWTGGKSCPHRDSIPGPSSP